MAIFEEASHPGAGRVVFAGLSVFIGGVASSVALLVTLQFFAVRRGEWIRPMGWAGLLFGLSVLGLLGVPCGIAGLFSPRRGRAILGIALSLAPLLVGEGVMQLAATVKGFHLAP
jgi:hypothetical protein